MPANNRRKNPFLLAPALVFVMLIFLILIGFIDFGVKNRLLAYLVTALLTLAVFGIPTGIYIFCRGARAMSGLEFRRLSGRQLAVSAAGCTVMIFQSCILRFGIFPSSAGDSTYALYGSSLSVSSVWELLPAMLSLVLLPALCEEVFFRGIVAYEYRFGGVTGAALMSSLLFAVIHLEFGQLPICFLNGLLLFFVGFLTGNLVCPILVHALYNLFALFGTRYVYLLSSGADSKVLFWLLLIAFYLTSLVLLLLAAAGQLRSRAAAADAPPVRVPRGKRPVVIYDMLSAPPFLIDLGCFLIFAVVNLFI